MLYLQILCIPRCEENVSAFSSISFKEPIHRDRRRRVKLIFNRSLRNSIYRL